MRQVFKPRQRFVDSSECVFRIQAQEGKLVRVIAMLAIVLVGVLGAVGQRKCVFSGAEVLPVWCSCRSMWARGVA